MGWKRDRIDGQKVYLAIFMSFLLRNEYLLEESGVDMSTPVHPVVPPLADDIRGAVAFQTSDCFLPIDKIISSC